MLNFIEKMNTSVFLNVQLVIHKEKHMAKISRKKSKFT